jgi:hypothetical protein
MKIVKGLTNVIHGAEGSASDEAHKARRGSGADEEPAR